MRRFALVLGAILVLLAVFAARLSYTGYVIVHDETGLATEARLTNSRQKQPLTALPFGYFVGIPEIEGGIEVRCSDGSMARGGYVTAHWKENVSVTGDGICERLRR